MPSEGSLPDVDGGLTERERFGLLAIGPGSKFRKSASVLQLGPPPREARDLGEISEFDRYVELVEFAQPWRTRYPLVDGEGNFGSVDDDPPAHPWYTEMRLNALGLEVIAGFGPDATAAAWSFPALMANGSLRGPARFVPHNLREVTAAIRARMLDPTLDVDGLMEHLPGPDFPCGGVILDSGSIRDLYSHGRGALRVRARIEVESNADGAASIVVSELPFLVAKGGEAGVIVGIVDRVYDRTLRGLADLHDESDGEMRLVIDASAGTDAATLTASLFEHTALETMVEVRMLAEVDGAPATVPMLQLIDRYIWSRRTVVGAEFGVSPRDVDDVIASELTRLADVFGDDRRTEIVPA